MKLIDQIRRDDPELANISVAEPATLKEIQSALPSDAVLVEYYHHGEHNVSGKKINELWIFIVRKESFEFKTIKVSQSELKSVLEQYADLLSNPNSNLQEITGHSNTLYGWLIEPVESSLNTSQPKTLILVPWGPMFKISFAALSKQGWEPLCARLNMVTAPSADIYRYMASKKVSGRNKIFALGNPQTQLQPLPGAEKEVEEIGLLFQKSVIRTRAEATEELMKADIVKRENPDVIHLACHGVFNDQQPELTYLALAADSINDGRLEVHEIFELDLKGVSLVTLSACSSGKSKSRIGEEIAGLTSGFIFAGSPSILSSLWEVDDEATRSFMVNFYRNYVGGMSKTDAMRSAQIAMMNSPQWSHPYHWSGFVLYGNWE